MTHRLKRVSDSAPVLICKVCGCEHRLPHSCKGLLECNSGVVKLCIVCSHSLDSTVGRRLKAFQIKTRKWRERTKPDQKAIVRTIATEWLADAFQRLIVGKGPWARIDRQKYVCELERRFFAKRSRDEDLTKLALEREQWMERRRREDIKSYRRYQARNKTKRKSRDDYFRPGFKTFEANAINQ